MRPCRSTQSDPAIPRSLPSSLWTLPRALCMMHRKIRTRVRCQPLGGWAAYGAVARGRKSFRENSAQISHVRPPPCGGGKMTAEVAIVNKHAIALAADSAVTVGRERVWKYANKLFSLGPHNDIGIMIYNSADFVGIPWETVVKEFRRHCAVTEFDTVKSAADHFINFIKSDKFLNDKEQFESFFRLILDLTMRVSRAISFKTYKEFNNNLAKFITDGMPQVTKSQIEFAIDKDDFVKRFKVSVKEICKVVLKHKPNDHLALRFCDYIFEWIFSEECVGFFIWYCLCGVRARGNAPCCP